ncbi:MAG: iron-containing alcohol dehydrogenase family protein, partial [Candidatus Rokuibacteriota bacterium]
MTEHLPSLFTWFHPTRVVFGAGALGGLPSLVAETAGARARVFLVTGRRSLRAAGVLEPVLEALGPGRVTLFENTPPFPSPATAAQALEACRRSAADVVVAIGGGSAMDVAKLVAVAMTHGGTPEAYATRQAPLERPGLPVVAVPTTSGSSSEVTPFVALWDLPGKRSMHLASPFLFPRVAVVDPDLARGMPASLAAVTGADAFTSAFESYWSTEATPLTDALNLEVIRLFAGHLAASCAVADPEARAACALAATVSGMAYTHSRPNACHAVSSPLTLYWDVAHGQAVCVTLPAFLRWTAEAMAPKLPALWRALGVDGLDAAVGRLTRLFAACGLATRLGALGVGPDGVETLVEHMRWE